MQIEINNRSRGKVSPQFIRRVLGRSFKRKDWKISIALVSPPEIKKINKIYRKKNKVTDVLSFLYEPLNGELVLCYEQIKAQAREHQVKIVRELARMLIHGALHLQGYEDESLRQAGKMRKLEDKILKNVEF